MINPTRTFIFYLLLTVFFVLFKFFITIKNLESDGDSKSEALFPAGVYILMSSALILTVNILNSQELCGPTKITDTLIYTLIPIGGLQIVFMYLLRNNPGWKRPFSNTLGYNITALFSYMGILPNIKNLIKNIFKTPKNSDIMDDTMLNDSQFMLNYFTPTSFCEKAIDLKRRGRLKGNVLCEVTNTCSNDVAQSGGYVDENMPKNSPIDDKIMTNCLKGDNNIELKSLYQLVLFKDCIAEALMMVLVGFLVITKSYNTIVNFQCAPVNDSKNEKAIKKAEKILEKDETDKNELTM
jgi:hypothetical protein